MATINGTAGNDFLKAVAEGDLVRGLAGGDVLMSAFNITTLEGGLGSDYVSLALIQADLGKAGRGTLDGGAGGDTLVASQAVSEYSGPATATNRLLGRDGFNILTASAVATANQDILNNPEAQIATASNTLRDGADRDILNANAAARGPFRARKIILTPVRGTMT